MTTRTLRVLAFADTHVSENMRLGGTAPMLDGRPLVLVQAERMLAWVADVARDHKVDLIMFAGDLYEQPNPRPAAEAVAVAALLRLASIAPTIVIPGNHDRPRGGGVHALEPMRNIAPERLFIADTPDAVHLVHAHDGDGDDVRLLTFSPNEWDAEETLFTIFPLPFPELGRASLGHGDAKAAVSHALDTILEQHAIAARKCTAPTAVLFHGTMAGAKFNDSQTAPLGDVGVRVGGVWSAFDVQAAGHLHKRQPAPGLSTSGYIGAPDRQDFSEEHEMPGVSLFTITIEDGSTTVDDDLIAYPGARVFKTLDLSTPLGELLIAGDDAASIHPTPNGFDEHSSGGVDHTVYRLKGVLTPDQAAHVVTYARAWRSRGRIIANQTTAQRVSRSRVTMDSSALGDLSKVLEAVFAAKPELADHREQITSDITGVWA